jgi:hypothetical protein
MNREELFPTNTAGFLQIAPYAFIQVCYTDVTIGSIFFHSSWHEGSVFTGLIAPANKINTPLIWRIQRYVTDANQSSSEVSSNTADKLYGHGRTYMKTLS